MKQKISSDIRKKIKRIKIFTQRVMQSALAGDYLSAFKGSGLEFQQIREYQMGDDPRFIDWNSVAKMGKMMVKQFVEERDRTVILAIDVSASSLYCSTHEMRNEMIAQLAATFAFIAQENKDKVGALFFADDVQAWIPPGRGENHVGTILEHIFSIDPQGRKTSINNALKFLINLKKRNAVVFMISDWIDSVDEYAKLMNVVSFEYDFIALSVRDEREHIFPDVGYLDVLDPENNSVHCLSTLKGKQDVSFFLGARHRLHKDFFQKINVDFLDLFIGKPFMNHIVQFLRRRIKKQV